MSTAFRKTTAALLVTFAVSLAGAAPAPARTLSAHRADPVHTETVRTFILHVLRQIFSFAGGAMDPNGVS
jgi:hypothetical protein